MADLIPVVVHVGDRTGVTDEVESQSSEEPVPPAVPPGTDMIACYRPWHIWGPAWGIWIHEERLRELAAWIAHTSRLPFATAAPLVLRQVLEHEWAHFDFEVIGTYAERLVNRPNAYRTYVAWRYRNVGPHRPDGELWTEGPLEEAVATWREVRFARVARLGGAREAFSRAVETAADLSPPGYREWAVMDPRRLKASERWSQPDAVIAAVLINLADAEDESLQLARWRETSFAERRQVPINWLGDLTNLSVYGAAEKSHGPIPINRWERFLRKVGADIDAARGRGDHRMYKLSDGRQGTYDPGAGYLYGPAIKQAMNALGIRSPADFYRRVMAS